MDEKYRKYYETPSYEYSRIKPPPAPEPVIRRPAPARKSYVAHIVIPIILLVFVVVVQLIFGIFDVLFPGSLNEKGEVTGGKRYVSITLDELSPTGYRMMSGNTVTGNVYYSFVDGRCLFVVLSRSDSKGSAPLKNYQLLGKIQAADGTVNSMLNKISSDLNLTTTSLSGTAYPFILSNVTTHMIIDMGLAVLLIITIIISFILLVIGLTRAVASRDRY